MINKKEIGVEETTVIDDEIPVKEKEVLKLNAVESLGYECLKSIFVVHSWLGMFYLLMIKKIVENNIILPIFRLN